TLTPSEIIDDKGYQQIFPRNNEISKEVYLACIRIAKPCDTIINSLKNRKSVKKINAFIATHFRFHIYSIAAALVTGKIDYDEDELAKISDDTVSKEMVLKIIEEVKIHFGKDDYKSIDLKSQEDAGLWTLVALSILEKLA